MKASDVPRVWRQSPVLAKAFEDGQKAGRAGVAADGNPHSAEIELPARGYTGRDGPPHAVRYASAYGAKSTCGVTLTEVHDDWGWNPNAVYVCKRCVRAVKAERKRLERAWEEGRLSTHPK